MRVDTSEHQERLLDGRRIALIGKLASMSRRHAEQLVRNHGGLIVGDVDAETQLVVVGDETPEVDRAVSAPDLQDESARSAWQEGRLQFVRESEFWERLGLVDSGQHVKRLYTPAMLADLVRAPVRAIRHWHRKRHLSAAREVGRLPYFDFEQVRVARRLGTLLSAGCSLSQIDRTLNELAHSLPGAARPLADASVVVVGRRLYVRRGDNLAEPSGQLLIDFDDSESASSGPCSDAAAATIPITGTTAGRETDRWNPAELAPSAGKDELRSLADEFEESGEPERAVEVYRAILMSGQFTAEDHFCLAELLYRNGDLAGSRERYYAAIELDEEYVEARANLGCVLAEQGERLLAEAAFRGALKYHPEFADAHYHLARLLDSMDQAVEASRHWKRFLELAPASPWAEEALDRTSGTMSS